MCIRIGYKAKSCENREICVSNSRSMVLGIFHICVCVLNSQVLKQKNVHVSFPVGMVLSFYVLQVFPHKGCHLPVGTDATRPNSALPIAGETLRKTVWPIAGVSQSRTSECQWEEPPQPPSKCIPDAEVNFVEDFSSCSNVHKAADFPTKRNSKKSFKISSLIF